MVYEWQLTTHLSEYNNYVYSYSYGEIPHGLQNLTSALAAATANSDSKVSHVSVESRLHVKNFIKLKFYPTGAAPLIVTGETRTCAPYLVQPWSMFESSARGYLFDATVTL